MAITEADVQARLRALIDPNTGKDFVAGKAVQEDRRSTAATSPSTSSSAIRRRRQHEILQEADRADARARCPASAASPST